MPLRTAIATKLVAEAAKSRRAKAWGFRVDKATGAAVIYNDNGFRHEMTVDLSQYKDRDEIEKDLLHDTIAEEDRLRKLHKPTELTPVKR